MNLRKKAHNIIHSSLTKDEKVRKLVDLVMNIPYKRIWSLNPSDMISKEAGSCTPKHIFLFQCLLKLEIPVKYLVIPFYYKNIALNIPNEYKSLVNNMPISYHIALKAKLKDTWVILDVTWDGKLNWFPLNNNWDWINDMKLWVYPEKIIERKTDPRIFEKRMWSKYTKNECIRRKEFYDFFDQFLIESRK